MVLRFRRKFDLRQRLAQGDDDAIAEVRALVDRATGPYKARLGAVWEDVAADSFITVYEACQADEFPEGVPFEGWVWRVVSHDCLDELRRQRRWQTVGLDTMLDLDAGSNQLNSLLQLEEGQGAQQILEEASPECREVWVLQLRGWSYRAISQELGVSEGALRVRCLRCRRWARSRKSQ